MHPVAVRTLAEPDAVGPFRLLQKLGHGGMGEVFLAEDTRLGRLVALKTVAGGQPQTQASRQQMLREARAAAHLNHPNIAAIHDVLHTGGRAYIVMEYVAGETLAERLRRVGRLRADEIASIGVQLADALVDAHKARVIHRDLKPSNVVLTPDGRVKVLDFGLARLKGAGADVTSDQPSTAHESSQPGAMRGTPAYMAPELFAGMPADERTDIYSVGVMLYELATGRRPFNGEDLLSLGLAVLTSSPPSARTLVADLPPALDAIIGRAMAREKEQRFRSATDLRAALQQTSGSPVVSTAEPPPAPTTVLVEDDRPAVVSGRSRRAATAIVGVLMALSFVLLAPILGVTPPHASGVVIAVLPLENITGDTSNDYLGVALAELITTDVARLEQVLVARAPSRQTPPDDARVVARELGASLVIGGSVQRQGPSLVATLRVMRADSSALAWSQDFEGAADRYLDLRKPMRDALVQALERAGAISTQASAVVAQAPTMNAAAFDEYARGLALIERHDVPHNVERAITAFQNARDRDPRFALAYAGLAESLWERYRETKDPSLIASAREAVDRALALEPDQPRGRYTLAVILDGTGRPDEAIAELRRTLAVQPRNDDAHRLLGRMLAARGRLEEAVAEFYQGIEIRPNFWQNHIWLGIAYLNAGRSFEAIGAFRRLTELQPDNARGFSLLGAAQLSAGRFEEGLLNFERANARAPSDDAWANIGTLHYWQGRYVDAAAAYTRAIELNPGESESFRNLGDAQLRLGLDAEARASYLDARRLIRERVRINPADEDGWSRLAVYEAKLGDLAAALESLGHVGDASSSAEAAYNRAVVLAFAARPDDAASALRRALLRGYPAETARRDDDLAAIRTHADVQALLDASR